VMGPQPDNQSIEKAVNDLGKGKQSIALVKLMTVDPSKAAGLLVSELSLVPETKLTADQQRGAVEHVLWAIRALRFLTGGKDFCASTVHRFAATQEEQNRRYWLRFRRHNCLSFFAAWPSRGSVYIAPRDVQEKIIVQWKKWYRTNGSTYRYNPLVDPRPEDWLL